jgi:hypothetical protein
MIAARGATGGAGTRSALCLSRGVSCPWQPPKVASRNMIRRPLHFYFYFGTAVRYLQDARAGDRIADDADGGRRIRTNLELVLAHMADLDLEASLHAPAAQHLRDLLQQLAPANDDAVLSEQQFRMLESSISELRASLEAELLSAYAYSPASGREQLVDDPAAHFAPEVFAAVPEIARLDLAAAARCLAFELPTAAAFHLLRAVDAVVQAFYASPVAARRRTDHGELFARLNRIRTEFSNPVQDPQALFSPSAAERLWLLALDVIDRMAPSLTPARSRSGT